MKKHYFLLYLPLISVTLIVAVIAFFYVETDSIGTLYSSRVEHELQEKTELLAPYCDSILSGSPATGLTIPERFLKSTRVTIISPEGKVIYDSVEDQSKMKSHANRPEFQAAQAAFRNHESAFFYRYSTTQNQELLYCSMPLDINGREFVLRTSVPLSSILEVADRLQNKLILAVVFAIAAALWLSFALFTGFTLPVRNLVLAVRRIAAGELTATLPIPKRGAIRELALSLSTMTGQLMHNIISISQEKSERDAIFSSLSEGVIVLDHSAKVVDLNSAAANMLDISLKMAVNKEFFSLLRHSEIEKFITSSFDNHIETSEKEFTFIPPSGPRHLRLRATPLFWDGEESSSSGLLLVIYNLTTERKLENFRRDFIANVSHEIKTPLTVIRGAVETLQDGALDNRKDAANFMKIIAAHSARLSALLEDILSLSDLECRAEPDTELINAADFIQTAMDLCNMRAAQRGSKLIFTDESNNTVISGDRRMLEQVMINLIDNAVKYSVDNDNIEISAYTGEKRLTIKVTDHGKGIAAEHLPRIFERFYRVDKSRNRESGGTGLGLAIVKHIVQLHSGTVKVDSLVGKGTVFTVTLPVFD